MRLPVTLEEIADGTEKKIRVFKYVSCESCSGSGAEGGENAMARCTACNGSGEERRVHNSAFGRIMNVTRCSQCRGEGQVIEKKCVVCKGQGRVRDESTINLTIPAGVRAGIIVNMRRDGNAGIRGGSPGDLRIRIEELPHKHFIREGNDIVYQLDVSFPDAVLGTDVEVPTLKGRVPVHINAGIQFGEELRLRGRGLSELHTGRRGDQIVRVRVWTPQELSETDKSLLEQLRKSSTFNTPPNSSSKGNRSFFERVKDVFT